MDKLILLALILVASCGKQVSISNNLLESNASSTSTSVAPNQDGIVIRGVRDQIRTSSAVYYVSMYSSYSALEFVASKPLGTQINVRFKGKIKNQDMVIQVIEAK
jgi:hypothetical protein